MRQYKKLFLITGLSLSLCFYSWTVLAQIVPGAFQLKEYLPLLKNKKIALVVNASSRVYQSHLVDTLLQMHVNVKNLFAPEHGFRGDADAGEELSNAKDKKTGLPIFSLYGKTRKPQKNQLKGIDLIVFDLQDVGVRFFTYLSTLHYVMEAAAENNIPLIVLDRPNPNGYYMDGPILDTAYSSFVGLHPVPIVYGMTIGEYAQMINGEAWLNKHITCKLKVITCKNYTHAMNYDLPYKPSPNLPNALSIALYPSVCLFEGTNISVGRGTDFPFQIIGKPDMQHADFSFTPKSIPGAALHPPYENQLCIGHDLRNYAQFIHYQRPQVNIGFIIDAYKADTSKGNFFTNYFDKLAGTDGLRKSIINGETESQIRHGWKKGLIQFMDIRDKYLLYPDFIKDFRD